MADDCPYERLLREPYAVPFEGLLGDAREVRCRAEVLEYDGVDHVFHVTNRFQLGFYRKLDGSELMAPELVMYDVRVGTFALFIDYLRLNGSGLEIVDSVCLFSSADRKSSSNALAEFGHLCTKDDESRLLFCPNPPARSRKDLVSIIRQMTE